jgi:hypothetical protein
MVDILLRDGYQVSHRDLSVRFSTPLTTISERSRQLMDDVTELIEDVSTCRPTFIFVSPALLLTHLALALLKSTDSVNNFRLPSAIYQLLCRKEVVLFFDRHAFSIESVGPMCHEYYGSLPRAEDRRCAAALERLKRLVGELSARGANIEQLDEAWEAPRRVLDRVSREGGPDSLLRMYVADGRFLAEQVAPLVRLFENYLNRVERCAVRVDSLRSSRGTLFIFRTPDGGGESVDLGGAIGRFDAFMAFCKNDPVGARARMVTLQLSPDDATAVVGRYSRQFGRVLSDIAEDIEARRQLLLRALKSEANERIRGARRATVQLDAAIGSGGFLAVYQAAAGRPPVDVQMAGGALADDVMLGLIRRTFGASPDYSEQETAIRSIFERHAEDVINRISLSADLEQLRDATAESGARREAKQRIHAWLSQNAASIGEGVTADVSDGIEALALAR